MERFWSKVDVRGPDDCWLWKAAQDGHGYGQFVLPGGSKTGAHRFAHFLTTGENPPAVCHSCDVPLCCNPRHLWSGTKKANALDRECKGRGNQPRGERQRSAKLTGAQVLVMRQRMQAGETCTALARAFNVHHSTILRAVSKEHWSHV